MGDFVRASAHSEPTASFESWIQEGMAYGEGKGGDWNAVYAAGAIHAFVFRPPKKSKATSVYAGVFRPSNDAVGRRFPLVIGAALDERTVAAGPHVLPLMLGDFFEQVTSTLMMRESVGTLSDFENQVGRVVTPQLDGANASVWEYDQWAHHTPIWNAWAAVYGDSASIAPIHAVHTIRECLSGLRGQETPSTPLSLRVPLGLGGVAAASFWIDVVRRIARWGATVPTFFFHFDGTSGTMLLQLGDTPPSSLAELWSPDPSSDYVCDLMGGARFDAEKILAKLPPPLAQVMQQTNRPVNELLAALTQ
jgi:type VI secretion system ImpM family protein